MTVCYNKLWQMCVEKGIKPSFFYSRKKAGQFYLSESTLYELRKNSPVSMRTIDILCSYFKCQPCDIMEFVND